jgi:hypothetical protein
MASSQQDHLVRKVIAISVSTTIKEIIENVISAAIVLL